MIRIAFVLVADYSWYGGVQYYKNLFYSLRLLHSTNIEPILFIGDNTDKSIIDLLRPYVKIFKLPIYNIDSRSKKLAYDSFYTRILARIRIFLSNFIINIYNIKILSHAPYVDKNRKFKYIIWIPDLQHFYYPELFSKKEIRDRDNNFRNAMESCDSIIVNSKAGLEDLRKYAPEYFDKAKVLRFACPIPETVYKGRFSNIINKYSLPKKYYYLPNQYWKHKNHLFAFNAILTLVTKGVKDITLICSGFNGDNRNPEYSKAIVNFIKINHLENNIRLLGFIPHEDVLLLMRYSIAVLNLSFFDGWSTTIEECKSLGKRMILSNIPVYKEQKAPQAFYVSPHNAKKLCAILQNLWLSSKGGADLKLEKYAKKKLRQRLLNYAKEYEKIALNTLRVG